MTRRAEDQRSRAEAYIAGLEEVLAKIDVGRLSPQHARLVELARAYLDDSKYYLEKGDEETALVTVAYAEGLLDALKFLGVLELEWRRPRKRKVLVAGTFDLIHPGHIYLLREAAKYGDLYVIVARDSNVRRIKGREPIFNEKCRLQLISSIRYVKQAILGDETDFLKPVVAVAPDLLVLGPDQPFDPEELRRELERRGLKTEVVKLGERIKEGCPTSTSRIIEIILERRCREESG